jgi:glycosyltransferase involved in cell wall biosynthesis
MTTGKATKRPRVLVLTPYFLPSEQGGGSVRAVQHLCEQLGADYEFVIAAGDRDLDSPLDPKACEAIRRQSGLDVRYLPYGPSLPSHLSALLAEPWDLVYMNSLLSPRFTLLPLLLLRGRLPALVAPRGELLPGALSLKKWRKRFYLGCLSLSGMLRKVHWHATSDEEAIRLRRLGPVSVAPDLPPRLRVLAPPLKPVSNGPLKLVFLSRIDRKKNLGFALRALQLVQCPIALDLYGPVTDISYWQQCQTLIAALPTHVTASYLGALAPHLVEETLRHYELFVLPTLGENHGYVIGEALGAGCLVLISDQTPWAGTPSCDLIRALPLDSPSGFASAIDEVANLDPSVRWKRRLEAQSLGQKLQSSTDAMNATRRMLDQLFGRSS